MTGQRMEHWCLSPLEKVIFVGLGAHRQVQNEACVGLYRKEWTREPSRGYRFTQSIIQVLFPLSDLSFIVVQMPWNSPERISVLLCKLQKSRGKKLFTLLHNPSDPLAEICQHYFSNSFINSIFVSMTPYFSLSDWKHG